MLDPIVHAALVTVFAWLVQLLFNAIGLDLGSEVYTALAQMIVAYILSLLGLGLWQRFTPSNKFVNDGTYKPPFVR